VEIPEAPFGGTLYRTLFLAGLVLFLMTFLVNTVAEVVRQRLRDRYKAI
jgi:phosphate transport system permease protein